MSDLLPFARRIIAQLRRLAGRARHTVSTVALAVRLGASERTVRWYLRRLELAGLVARKSPRTGWLPA